MPTSLGGRGSTASADSTSERKVAAMGSALRRRPFPGTTAASDAAVSAAVVVDVVAEGMFFFFAFMAI